MNHPANVGFESPHDHVFRLDRPHGGERATWIVVALTTVTMAVEIAAGLAYRSMALLADGLHMASHAVALGIAALAYRYARRHAADPRFSFGTGKVNALAGYSGAILLGVFSLTMVVESVERLLNPLPIAVDQALIVAVVGLVINGLSVAILGSGHEHPHGESSADAASERPALGPPGLVPSVAPGISRHSPLHDAEHHQDRDPHKQGHDHHDHHHDDDHHHDHHHDDDRHHDHNLRAAYLHVLADALTSVLAIAALLAAKYGGALWLDPVMGVIGALLVARWAVGLLRQSSLVLLDHQAPVDEVGQLRQVYAQLPGTRVVDVHLWSVGVGRRAAIVALEAEAPLALRDYRALVPLDLSVVHLTVEVGVPRSTPAG